MSSDPPSGVMPAVSQMMATPSSDLTLCQQINLRALVYSRKQEQHNTNKQAVAMKSLKHLTYFYSYADPVSL